MDNSNFYIDTHCHLDFITKDDNILKNIIINSEKIGIKYIFNISTDFYNFFYFANRLKDYKNIFYSIGLSPNDLNSLKSINDKKKFIKENIDKGLSLYRDKIIGVGEIGLDYYWNKENKEQQKEIFLVQVESAIKNNLPIILHIRDAFNDLLEIFYSYKNIFEKTNIIFHCFSGNIEIIKNLEKLNLNFYYSFAGNITYDKSFNLKDSFYYLPIDKIILETDSPFLTPVPKRGEKNSPNNIIYTYKYCCNLKKIEENIFKEIIAKNVFEIFNKTLFGTYSRLY